MYTHACTPYNNPAEIRGYLHVAGPCTYMYI